MKKRKDTLKFVKTSISRVTKFDQQKLNGGQTEPISKLDMPINPSALESQCICNPG